jgi:hypothetical protein
MALQFVTLSVDASYLPHKSTKIVEAVQIITIFLLKNISFDIALNFNQVDFPYPVWNRVKKFVFSD